MSNFVLNLEKKNESIYSKIWLTVFEEHLYTQSSLLTSVGTDKLEPGVPSSARKMTIHQYKP